jgi:hypothetical protein
MNEAPQPHGIGKMLALPLIPGALLTLFFMLTAPSLPGSATSSLAFGRTPSSIRLPCSPSCHCCSGRAIV